MKTRKFLVRPLALVSVSLVMSTVCLWGEEIRVEDPEEGAHPCDWTSAKAEWRNGAFFLSLRSAKPVNLEKGAAYTVFMDTDQNPRTGFRGSSGEFPVGADYLIQGVTLFQYSGSGTDWSWNQLEAVPFELKDQELAMEISKEALGNPEGGVDFFCLGDNEAPGVDGALTDVMPDGALHNGDKIRVPGPESR